MNLLPETKEIQSRMAMYCRTGVEPALPGVTPNRFHHYHRLIFNIIQEHLESSYPITFEYVPTEIWYSMLNNFFADHLCQSYQVWQIAGEFYQYAIDKKFSEKFDLYYLNDLLKFEWEELRLYNMENLAFPKFQNEGDDLIHPIVLNPEHVLLTLQYPVHQYSPSESLKHQGNYFILLYREKETGRIQFMEISVWHAIMIEQFSQGNITLTDLLLEAPSIFDKIDIKELTDSSLKFLEEMKEKSFVLGYKN